MKIMRNIWITKCSKSSLWSREERLFLFIRSVGHIADHLVIRNIVISSLEHQTLAFSHFSSKFNSFNTWFEIFAVNLLSRFFVWFYLTIIKILCVRNIRSECALVTLFLIFDIVSGFISFLGRGFKHCLVEIKRYFHS